MAGETRIADRCELEHRPRDEGQVPGGHPVRSPPLEQRLDRARAGGRTDEAITPREIVGAFVDGVDGDAKRLRVVPGLEQMVRGEGAHSIGAGFVRMSDPTMDLRESV